MWKSELVNNRFIKAKLKGHKYQIKAKLIKLIENGDLYKETLPKKETIDKSSLLDRLKNARLEIRNISHGLKQSNNKVPLPKRLNLQPIIEDIEDNGEDNKTKEDLMVVQQKDWHPISKSPSLKEIA